MNTLHTFQDHLFTELWAVVMVDQPAHHNLAHFRHHNRKALTKMLEVSMVEYINRFSLVLD